MADKFDGIRMTPTTTDKVPPIKNELRYHRRERKMHESLLRGYKILEETKKWLEKGVPPDVVLEFIHHLENPPSVWDKVQDMIDRGILSEAGKYDKLDDRRLKALEYAAIYGNVTKKAHLHWLIDQMVRCLSSDYEVWLNEITESGEDSYEWRIGRSPIGGSKRGTKQRGNE